MNKKNLLIFILAIIVLFSFANCSSEKDQSPDIDNADTGDIEDIFTYDVEYKDISSDINRPQKYFALSFDDNKIRFFDREKNSNEPFFSVSSSGEISSIEFIPEKDMIVFSNLSTKELIFIKEFIEVKRIQGIGDYPYSLKYLPVISHLIVPDKSSNRLYIFDIESMEMSLISPMSAGGNYPISVCYDEKPRTQELLLRLLILNYGSLNVRAYDIFERDNWALRSEKLPALSEPISIACDSINRRLLVINSGSNNISAFGLDDLVQIANSPFEAGKNPTYAAMHLGASIAYVSNTSDDSLTIFSTKEMKAKGGISFKPQDRPTRVYVNEPENRLYVVLSGAKALVVYNIEDPLIPEKIAQIVFTNTPKELIFK